MTYTSDELVPVADLLTLAELSVWVEETLDETNERAKLTISAASLVVCEAAGHPEWTIATAPGRARLIAAQLAKRTYLNPNAEKSYSLGPLGGSTVEDFARTLELTPYEREVLEGYDPAGSTADAAAGVLFTASTYNRRSAPVAPIVLNDDSGSGIIYGTEGEFDTAFGDPV